MNPLMNCFPLQVHVSPRHGCMCHCSDNSLCLSSRKPADYPETLLLNEGAATGWGFTDDHPRIHRQNVCLGFRGRWEWHSTTCSSDKQVHVWGREKKRLLEGFQCHPSLPPAISLLQLRAAEQNYFPPVNNKEVYETWRMRWHTTWNTNEEGAPA